MGGEEVSMTVSGESAGETLSERRRVFRERRRRRARRVWAVLGVLAAVGVGWGWRAWVVHGELHAEVRQPARDGDPAVPTVVWPRGLPDHGRWQGNPWVEAVRELELLEAVAYNTGRLNGRADLLALMSPEQLDQRQGSLSFDWELDLSQGREIPVQPGPRTFEVIDVVVDESGNSATVDACVVREYLTHSTDSPADVLSGKSSSDPQLAGYNARWALERAPDGHIVFVREGSFQGKHGGRCRIRDAHYGLFDPQPVHPTSVPEVERWQDPESEGFSGDVDELMSEYDELRDIAEETAAG